MPFADVFLALLVSGAVMLAGGLVLYPFEKKNPGGNRGRADKR